MTAEELLDSYPAIREAVAATEMMVRWEEERDTDSEVLSRNIATAIEESMAERPEWAQQLSLARSQMDMPAYREYLAGRLGLV